METNDEEKMDVSDAPGATDGTGQEDLPTTDGTGQEDLPKVFTNLAESREDTTPTYGESNCQKNVTGDTCIEKTEMEIFTKEQELLSLYTAACTHYKSHPTEGKDEKIKIITDIMKLLRMRQTTTVVKGAESVTIKKEIENPKEITLLLVGSAGNGKSATGNTILGRQAFQTTASTSSTNSEFSKQSTTLGDLTVNVIDGPGVDTEKSPDEILALSVQSVENALKLCDYKFTGLVMILKYGQRFTKQESEMIKIIKGILGENVFKTFGVCVITHGDNFQADFEDEEMSFEDWCKQQQGEIKNLFEECNNRYVLFNNRDKNQNSKDQQVTSLLKYVSLNNQYTHDDLKAAYTNLQKLMVETKAPKILEETVAFIKDKRKLAEITESAEDPDTCYAAFESILNDIERFEQSLMDAYGDPDNIKQPLMETKILRMEINSKMKKRQRIIETEQLRADLVFNMAKGKHKLSDDDDDKHSKKMQGQSSKSPSNFDYKLESMETDTNLSNPCTNVELSSNKQNDENVSKNGNDSYQVVYESIHSFINQLEKMKYDVSQNLHLWTNMKSIFEKQENIWKHQMSNLSDEKQEELYSLKITIIKMLNDYKPKDADSLFNKIKNFLLKPLNYLK